jgi:predicted RNase H-like nuclease (RuvC/YqgF family)
MANELQDTLTRLGEKSRFLTERYRVVVQQRDTALSTVQELTKTLRQRDKEVEELKMKLNYLTVSSSIAPDKASLEQTTAIISSLVRDIDRCIADLKE